MHMYSYMHEVIGSAQLIYSIYIRIHWAVVSNALIVNIISSICTYKYLENTQRNRFWYKWNRIHCQKLSNRNFKESALPLNSSNPWTLKVIFKIFFYINGATVKGEPWPCLVYILLGSIIAFTSFEIEIQPIYCLRRLNPPNISMVLLCFLPLLV